MTSILERVAARDEAAVRECMDRYGALVWSLARRFTRNAEDAADAVQDVFIDLWSNAVRFDPAIASETTFVATIARRRLIDRLRRKEREPAAAPLGEAAAVPAEPDVDRVELSEEAARAAAVFRTLRPEEQRVLRLSVYEGLSHRRIAERLDLPLGTVKTHVRRGLLRIRDALGGDR